MSTEKLTDQESYAVWLVIEKVRKNLEWNRDDKMYRENSDNFILSLSKAEMSALRRAQLKIQ